MINCFCMWLSIWLPMLCRLLVFNALSFSFRVCCFPFGFCFSSVFIIDFKDAQTTLAWCLYVQWMGNCFFMFLFSWFKMIEMNWFSRSMKQFSLCLASHRLSITGVWLVCTSFFLLLANGTILLLFIPLISRFIRSFAIVCVRLTILSWSICS